MVSFDSGHCWYHVRYSDGDEEDLSPKDLLKFISGINGKDKARELLHHPAHTTTSARKRKIVVDEDEDEKACDEDGVDEAEDEEEDDDEDFQLVREAKVKVDKGLLSKGKENYSSPRKAAVSSKAKVKAEKKAGPKRTEATFNDQDLKLWESEDIPPPKQIPRTVRVLELFAGCGGLHSDGEATSGKLTVRVESVAAVEVEPVPAQTYKHNFPKASYGSGLRQFRAIPSFAPSSALSSWFFTVGVMLPLL